MPSVTLSGQSLTISQGGIGRWAKMSGVLPAVTADATMVASGHATGQVVLPPVTGVSYGGASASFTLPVPTFSGGMTIPNLGRVEAVLPVVAVSVSMLIGTKATAATRLPFLQVTTKTGAKAESIVLPLLQISATAMVQEDATLAIKLPAILAGATGSLWSDVASAAIVLPTLHSAGSGAAQIVLPRLRVAAHGTTAIESNQYTAYAMNVTNNAVTTFANYPFRVFVRFQNKYYGVGLDGNMYLLSGDTDAGTPISWEFETGLDDMDNPAQKGVLGVYVDGMIEKGAELTVVTDTKARYMYDMHTPSSTVDHRPYRVLTGRGVRTRNIGIAMRNTSGGYVEVDQIAPEYVISKRNI